MHTPRETPAKDDEVASNSSDDGSDHTVAADSRQRRGGRPLDPSRDRAILDATIECLAEHGYERCTMQMVAERARAGKGALYRRWSTKVELVTEALAYLVTSEVDVPDTGTLRGDLDELAKRVPDIRSDRGRTGVIVGLAIAARYDADLAEAYQRSFVEPRASALRTVLTRAQHRGEVHPDRDIELLVAIVPALLLGGSLPSGATPGRAFAKRVFDEIVYPSAVAGVRSA